ncbi:MAG: hypothetical protein FWG20_03920 [Candidatus Cloacimonetes bacterium]|nr:hypothetical protein [Candidatus Cloacimonadota bacterium]
MKKRILFILLISLAFNAGFICMGIFHHFSKPKNYMLPIPPRFQKDHKFPRPSQNEEIIALRKINVELRKSFFQELAKTELDTTKIAELSQQLQESQNEMEKVVLQHFVDIRNNHPVDEAVEYFQKLENVYLEKKNKHKGGAQ